MLNTRTLLACLNHYCREIKVQTLYPMIMGGLGNGVTFQKVDNEMKVFDYVWDVRGFFLFVWVFGFFFYL